MEAETRTYPHWASDKVSLWHVIDMKDCTIEAAFAKICVYLGIIERLEDNPRKYGFMFYRLPHSCMGDITPPGAYSAGHAMQH